MKPKLHMCSLNFQKHICVSYFNNIDTIIIAQERPGTSQTPSSPRETERPKKEKVEKPTENASDKASFSRKTSNKNRRRQDTLPPSGKPGGIDDPLRKGLSGSGVRWYLRSLEESQTSKESRKKAIDRKKPQEQPLQHTQT